MQNFSATDGVLLQYTSTNNIQAGYAVGGGGDVNGDGFNDMVIFAPQDSPQGRTAAGTIYVIYGKVGLPSVIELPNITSTDGFILQGPHATAGANNGRVQIVEDINGDGLDEVFVSFISDPALGRTFAGSAYIIYGSKVSPGVIDLASISSSQGVLIAGDTNNAFGQFIGACDVNGDGKKDFLISRIGGSATGGAFLIYGNSSLPSVIDTK